MGEPNTTQTPNSIFDDLMPQMGEADLKVVLQVTRYTFGWIADPATGVRKKEDRISRKLLMRRCGMQEQAISRAVNKCIKRGWIEARSQYGEILDTPDKRRGTNIFYRLGEKLLHVRKSHSTCVKSEVRKSHITKETLNKKRAIEIFKTVDNLIDAFKTNFRMRLKDKEGFSVVISKGNFRCKTNAGWVNWGGDWKELIVSYK